VLSLEISGPSRDHFSIIDVPDIFKRITQRVTMKYDMNMINCMVNSYVRKSCNVERCSCQCLTLVRKKSWEGWRGRHRRHMNLSVLTRQDLVDKGVKKAVVDLRLPTLSIGSMRYVQICFVRRQSLHLDVRPRRIGHQYSSDSVLM
jgi:hypothetical protein